MLNIDFKKEITFIKVSIFEKVRHTLKVACTLFEESHMIYLYLLAMKIYQCFYQ